MNKKYLLLASLVLTGLIHVFGALRKIPQDMAPMGGSSLLRNSGAMPAMSPDHEINQSVTTSVKKDEVSQEILAYQEAAYALAGKMEKLGLDGKELDDLYTRVGKENFLKHVPEEIRPDYLRLEEKVAALRQSYLKQDGMSEKFFTKYQVQMPEWIEKQRQELEKAVLPSSVESMVNKKINESELNNDDINEILTGCGRGNSSCINKAFATLIDAHHGLEASQLKMIQEYL